MVGLNMQGQQTGKSEAQELFAACSICLDCCAETGFAFTSLWTSHGTSSADRVELTRVTQYFILIIGFASGFPL